MNLHVSGQFASSVAQHEGIELQMMDVFCPYKTCSLVLMEYYMQELYLKEIAAFFVVG